MKIRSSGLALAAIALLIAFQGTPPWSDFAIPASARGLLADDVDLTHLPLGDGRLSTSPQVGYIWPCHTDPSAGGAFKDGPWINKTDGTYNFTAKAVVNGSIGWPKHQLQIKVVGDKRVITTNDLPDHNTGVFPIASNDDAYQYDRNPNKIATQNFKIELLANPVLAAEPSCAPGAVGVLLSGVALFNALDAPGRDAVAHETQDACQGHPQESGDYHYHSVTTCLPDKTTTDGHSTLVGYGLDGFGIYGRRGEGGKILTSADLDECHGHTHEIEWNGQKVMMYHYHATWDFPYTIGCMRGTYSMSDVMTISGGPGKGQGQGGNGQQPPQGQGQQTGKPDLAAAAKKLGITEQKLRDALGPPPPNLAAAAKKLGITEQKLRDALGIP